MLLPEPMSRILVVGTKDRLPATIDLLYSLEDIHVVDFSPEEEGFTLGSPLPAASDASHKLLKLRSVEKDLEVDEAKYKEKIPVKKVESTLATSIADIESEIMGVVSSKNAKQARLSEVEGRKKALEPFSSLPLDLEMYTGYQSLETFTGFVRSDPEKALQEALGGNFELFKSEDATFIALFVPTKQAEEAQRILVQSGYTEAPVPAGTGRPADLIKGLDEEAATLQKEMAEVSEKLDQLREKHAAYILASEEYLGIQVEKAELPLRMGETAHSFVLEAWVPTNDYDKITKAFSERFDDSIYIEVLEKKERGEEFHSELGEKVEAGALTAEAETEPIQQETPVKLNNGKNTSRFEYFTKLISTPRYNEIDPTIALAIFFPIFFGLMVGDLGYGAIFIVLGYLGLKKTKVPEWRAISTMLFYGGISSAFFGIFMFGDMLGIEFTAIHEAAAGAAEGIPTYTWSALLGIDIPHVLFNIGGFPVQLGYFSKLEDVKILLYMSVWIGIAHLLIGLVLGMYNVSLRHGLKHAVIEKFSWIMMLVGGASLLLILTGVLIQGQSLSFTDPLFILFVVLFVPGLLMALKGEGGKALIELPEMMSNVLSYTRLTAIGLSKAGMALAFNYISLGLIAGISIVDGHAVRGDVGILLLIVAVAVFVVGHLMIFILAIISAGLHGVRLQYVELFTKFYEGGGLEFNPLKIRRKHTTTEE